jgi:prepilin-type N-terminal cleavage/methylation domain-containing protein/prepilin-type processing-associated H-X9-DG protein
MKTTPPISRRILPVDWSGQDWPVTIRRKHHRPSPHELLLDRGNAWSTNPNPFMNTRYFRRFQGPQAFTLIELLVVIAIVAMLAALAFTGLSRTLESGRAAACASNLRQFAVAINLYTADNNSRYPGPSWYSVNWDIWHFNSPYQSLTVHLAPYMGVPSLSQIGTNHYTVKSAICPTWKRLDPSKITHYARVSDPALSPFGGQNLSSGDIYEPMTVAGAPGILKKNASDIMAIRDIPRSAPQTVHKGGQNVLFLDGHVEWLSGRLEPNRGLKP